ncbi:SIR2 family protein [Micromonospora sp. NPDC000663]|uniref:SIR2 family protein n=1 Tax=Micromonospora sp. NPDC000663 TaxID=3364218 RepID=UPI003673A450
MIKVDAEVPVSPYLRNEIVEAIRRGDAIFIVGAGVSLLASDGAESASWKGLIRAGVDRSADLDQSLSGRWRSSKLKALSSTADSAQMISVAQEVERHLKQIPGNHYGKFLAETVGSLPMVRRGIIDVLKDSGAPVLTTNYDSLLEQGTGRDAATWQRISHLQDEIKQPGRFIVHLHGHWREPETIVFGYESYARVIGDSESQAMLRALLATKAIVFVGFGQGLEDPNFAALTTWLTSTLGSSGIAPAVLVRNRELASAQSRFRALGVNALAYGDAYDDLELYLADIVREANAVPTPGIKEFTWESLAPKLMRLHRRIARSFAPDFVVAMSGPGNFAPAYCLAHSSEDPPLLAAVTFPRRPDRSRHNLAFEKLASNGGWLHHESDKWDVFLPNVIRDFPAGSRALIFDDRVVGGRVQHAIAEMLKGFGYEVRRAALVVDPRQTSAVDFYEEVVDGDFVFPWGGKHGRGEPAS